MFDTKKSHLVTIIFVVVRPQIKRAKQHEERDTVEDVEVLGPVGEVTLYVEGLDGVYQYQDELDLETTAMVWSKTMVSPVSPQCRYHNRVWTRWGRNKMLAILQTRSNALSWMQAFEFPLTFGPVDNKPSVFQIMAW